VTVHSYESSVKERNEIRFAEASLLFAVVAPHSTEWRTLCTQKPLACSGGDRGELAIALIAARNSPASLHSLVTLHRYRLDAAYGESFGQYVCEKGARLEKYLVAVNPEELHQECISDFERLMKRHGTELAGAKVGDVCAEASQIKAHLQQSLTMVRRPPRSCEP
jgi:Immunity protein 57